MWPGLYCDMKKSCCYTTTGEPPSDLGIHGLGLNFKDNTYPSNFDPSNDDGRIVIISKNNGGSMKEKEHANEEKLKLNLKNIPFALTCILHKNYIMADPTSEDESIMETFLTVVLDSSFCLVSLNKPARPGLAQISPI